MVKKVQNKDNTGTVTSDSESFENINSLWSDFSGQMEDKMRELIETSATEYREIYRSWSELSDKMGKQMLDFTVGDEAIFKNIYNSWKEYSERLNIDLGKVSKADDKSYSEFYDFWTNYSEKFGNQLSDFMREGFREQYELYELWMDTFAKNVHEGSKSGDIPSIINKYWLETFNRFNDFITHNGLTIPSEQPEPGEQIYKQYEEMYNYWLNTSQKMLDEVMRSPAYGTFLAQSINSSMDTQKMYKNIMTENLKRMGVPTKNELEEIRWELKNISTQIKELNQTMQELTKKK